MNESKMEILRSVFGDFHTISCKMEEREIKHTPDDESQGNSETVTEKLLKITVNHRTAEELSDQYGFTSEQNRQLLEL